MRALEDFDSSCLFESLNLSIERVAIASLRVSADTSVTENQENRLRNEQKK